jgi:argininosuccinate synthase
MNTHRTARRVVLAYSGGLNGSVAVPWLIEAADVIAMTLDLGQHGDLEEVRDRALATGALRAHVLDARDEFARDFIARALKADALAPGPDAPDLQRPLVSELAAPILAQKLVEVAAIEQATRVAHGAADPAAAARIETAVRALNPQLTVCAPARDWDLTRAGAMAYARKRGLPIPVAVQTPYGVDANLWGRALGLGVIDVSAGPLEEMLGMFTLTKPVTACPGEPAHLDLTFERGMPTAVNGVSMPLIDLIATVEMIAGGHGVGRTVPRDPSPEPRAASPEPRAPEPRAASRELSPLIEAPAAVVLHAAHAELQKLVTTKEAARPSRRVTREYVDLIGRGTWFSPLRDELDACVDRVQDRVNGVIHVELSRGAARYVAEPRTSPRRLVVVSTGRTDTKGPLNVR